MAIFYWTIQLDSIVAPSAIEVKLGQDGNGGALPASQQGQVTDTGQAPPLDGAVSTPLQEAQDYLVSWVWDDGAGDLRGPVSGPFTTLTVSFTRTRDETIDFADSQTAVADGVGARTESVAFTDSQTAVASNDSTVTETVDLTDSQNWAVEAPGLRTESVDFTDSQNWTVEAPGLRTESVDFTDVQTASEVPAGSATLTESVDFTDVQTATADHVAVLTETVDFTDSQTGIDAVVARTRTEQIAFSHSQSGFIPGTGIITKIGGDDAPRKRPRRSTNRIREEEAIIEILAMLALQEEVLT